MPSNASRFLFSLGGKIKETSQTAGTLVGEAAMDATGKVADVVEQVGSATGHAVVSAAATTGTFIREGITETIGKVAVGKTKAEEVQGKDRPYINNVAEQPGLEDSHTYIEGIQLEKIINNVRASPDDPKTEPIIDDDSEKLLPLQNPDRHLINVGDTEDIGREGGSSRKVWIFLIANLGIEILSAAFDQLSSVRELKYALAAMLMAYVGLLGCTTEIAFKGRKERVSWRWDREIPWFYYSTTYRRFGTFSEIFGLVCAILQSISSTVAYVLFSKQAQYPIKGSFLSVVFAFGLLCSQFLKDRSRKLARPVRGD